MEFKKPKTGEIAPVLATGAGATLGFIAPNGLANAYAKVDDEALITDDQKNKKMYVNAICLVGGLALAVMVKGTDMGASTLRGAGYGLAGGGAKGLITHFAKDKITPKATVAGRFVAGALGCPCESNLSEYRALQMPRSLRMPISEMIQPSNQIAFDL